MLTVWLIAIALLLRNALMPAAVMEVYDTWAVFRYLTVALRVVGNEVSAPGKGLSRNLYFNYVRCLPNFCIR